MRTNNSLNLKAAIEMESKVLPNLKVGQTVEIRSVGRPPVEGRITEIKPDFIWIFNEASSLTEDSGEIHIPFREIIEIKFV